MRIVQLANFYNPASGGLRTCVDEVGRGYLAAGHERVLVVPGLTEADEQTPSGRRVTLRGPRFGSGGYHILTARRTKPLLQQLRPDVIECSDKLSMRWLAPWARRHGVPLVLFSHERIDAILRTRVPPGFPLATAADLANRRLSARAEYIVVTSGFARAEFTRIGARNVRRVPLGVDLDIFHPLEPIAEPAGAVRGAGDRLRHLGAVPDVASRPVAERPHVAVPAHAEAATDTVNLVLVSRLSREKHPGKAIEALRLLVHAGVAAELTVIGDGPLRERMQQRAAGLPVRFLGHVTDRTVMADLVARADIAVCPSPAETFGLAVLEALACGTPVVVPRDGAARELLGPVGSGIECDGTPDGLAAGIQALLRVPPTERRRAARLSAERFPWSATVTGMLDLYAGYLPTAQAAG